MDEHITLEVLRYKPEENSEQIYQSYKVPYRKDWVILDALNYIKDEMDGTYLIGGLAEWVYAAAVE